uniref:Uncharacterized protein n=1 Tax=Romanomermis culicivorax TaxID=13658 RepID=A0A915K6W7_ROMCU
MIYSSVAIAIYMTNVEVLTSVVPVDGAFWLAPYQFDHSRKRSVVGQSAVIKNHLIAVGLFVINRQQ